MVRAILHEGEIREAIGLPGNGDLVVESVAALDEPDDHRLYWFDGAAPDPALESVARHTGCIVIVPEGFAAAGDLGTCRVLEVPDPRAAIAKVLRLILTTHRQPPLVDNREIAPDATVSTQAIVEGNVRIGPGVSIGPFCTVGPDVAIGSGSVLEPGVRVYRRVSIGEESTIGANSVIEGRVSDSAVWDDCRIASGVTLERCIVAHGVNLTESGDFRDLLITADEATGVRFTNTHAQ